jgi:hypothetical protein
MASPPDGTPVDLPAELLVQLARYAGLELPADYAAQIAPLLAVPLGVARSLRPDDYDDLVPATVYRVPPEA